MNPIDLNLLAAQRRNAIDEIIIDNTRAAEAHGVFDYLVEHASRATKGKRCVLLTGPTQSGKSTILETYAAKHNTPEALAQGLIPVLHVTLEANVTRKGLAQNILEAISDFGVETGHQSGSEVILLQRARGYLQKLGVKLLVLDEFQHLVHSESSRLAMSVGETIKRMLIKGVCPIVLSGIEGAEKPLVNNKQLAMRAEPTIELRPLLVVDAKDGEFFMQFLATFLLEVERKAGVTNATSLLEGDAPAMICEVAQGVLGAACNLIKASVKLATNDGRNFVTLDDLVQATDRAFIANYLYERNPFRDGLAELKLVNSLAIAA